ncbi:unnamed protein product, partial [Discosporangium mesarthrocarpum]
MAAYAGASGSLPGGACSPGVVWQWLEDGHRWMNYEAQLNSQVEAAYVGGAADCVVSSPGGGKYGRGTTYTVEFGIMSQVNMSTSWVRKVRRYSTGGNAAWEDWKWSRDQMLWSPLESWVCQQIVVSRDIRGETQTTVHLPGQLGGGEVVPHLLDFANGTQTCLNSLS